MKPCTYFLMLITLVLTLQSCHHQRFGFRKTYKVDEPTTPQQRNKQHTEKDQTITTDAPKPPVASTPPKVSVKKKKSSDKVTTQQLVPTAKQLPPKPVKPGNKKLFDAGTQFWALSLGLVLAVLTILFITFLFVGSSLSLVAFFGNPFIFTMLLAALFVFILGGILRIASRYHPEPKSPKEVYTSLSKYFMIAGIVIAGLPFLIGMFDDVASASTTFVTCYLIGLGLIVLSVICTLKAKDLDN